jgi:hypothetical protein
LGLAGAAWLVAAPVAAQDSAAAGALFDKGVAEMASGNYQVACPALEESQRIDPRAGTLFASAECQAKWGKIASAVARYEDYVGWVSRLPTDQQARHRDRVATSQAQIAQLKPTVPTLTIRLVAGAPSGTTIKRDGALLQGAALGVALPVDPGEHTLTVQAPGGPERSVKVDVASSQNRLVELEAPPAPEAKTKPEAGTGPSEPAPLPATNREPTADRGSSRRTIAYAVGGLGVAGVVVGGVTGVLVLGKKSTITDNCDGSACRNDTGYDAARSAKTLATVSTVGFGVGVAGLAVSAVLLLTGSTSERAASSAARTQPLLAPSSQGLWAGVERTF